MAEGESYPSISEMIEQGLPPEYLPIMIISMILLLFMIAVSIWNVMRHKKFSTKQPIQFFCNMGILQVYPFFALMHTTSLVVPKFTDVAVFLAEFYEALTFLFFLRLVLTFMGGKKNHKDTLKGQHVHLNVFPINCFICLPEIQYSHRYFRINECLIVFYSIYTTVLGYINLVSVMDSSSTYPANAVEQKFSLFFHISGFWVLIIAIYGLSGIFHSAQDQLVHRNIVKKFLVYKIYVTLVKLQIVIIGAVAHHEGFDQGFDYNELFTTESRIKALNSFFVVVEAALFFPLAVYYYPIDDYNHPHALPTLKPRVISNTAAKEELLEDGLGGGKYPSSKVETIPVETV